MNAVTYHILCVRVVCIDSNVRYHHNARFGCLYNDVVAIITVVLEKLSVCSILISLSDIVLMVKMTSFGVTPSS